MRFFSPVCVCVFSSHKRGAKRAGGRRAEVSLRRQQQQLRTALGPVLWDQVYLLFLSLRSNLVWTSA